VSLEASVEAERLIAESQSSGGVAESLDYDASGELRRALEARSRRTVLGPVTGHDNSRNPDRSVWVPVHLVTFHGVGNDDDEADDPRPWVVELAEVAVLDWKGNYNDERQHG
jgi:hypothetical protein